MTNNVTCHFDSFKQNQDGLKITGAVEALFELGGDERLKMEMQTITATLEGAGNGPRLLQTVA